MSTIRLTMAQALVRFLARQHVARDGMEIPFVHGVFAIFGHGNVTGLGEALEFDAEGLRCYQGHNEQGMALAATAFARQKNRLGILACTSSIGPGATNMITAAATATTNRLPLLLLPGDTFACRQPDPVLQQLEVPHDYTQSVNDCFRPVSRYWDRITRPEQLMSACMNAFRVLTCPVDTGAVTLCLPQDVQSEAYDYPLAFFEKRVWHIERSSVSARALDEAVSILLKASRPLIIAGGGVRYSEASEVLATFAQKHAIPVAQTQAGKGTLAAAHPFNVGGIGVTGTLAANRLAARADVVLVIGSRLQDFTTASKAAFGKEGCRILHLNVCSMDALKLDGLALRGDARMGLMQLDEALEARQSPLAWQHEVQTVLEQWRAEAARLCEPAPQESPELSQTAVLGMINRAMCRGDVVIGAAGSLPGDLHRLWQCHSPEEYHLEYAYSCMGYEVAAGLGVRLAIGKGTREIFVLVGDGSYLMLHSELLTCVQEGLKITVVVFDNHGYQCIHNLQRSQGSNGFGNEFRKRCLERGTLTGDILPIDFCRYAEALGAKAIHADSYKAVAEALADARRHDGPCVISIPVAPDSMSGGYETWWRVGVAEVSVSDAVRKAHARMQAQVESIGGK
ncbi:3D-(3,5/4)-trihydroxycyclohexane-1,2-dione acylhydrolase (decyclizing) [Legionella geestiana]|uniref:3D-(3,5/4)-trihydroxycyclohexane-1,2-dione acylhydrolase (decyclizing) n=1 Tax=Legionella geestiana TaxID=45065 RepID=UPI001092A14B|nr:3D-(3,5/4)-trihydroxycyclohexane-1,2-dione acylhydrolase (decyclizing) [Legionella geestiana]QDQ40905.1 3D-(3,5/4)-trihydroxycyclohexane-1,2-dione acylhydrolase (decyclizing) [Legionella geestiana]